MTKELKGYKQKSGDNKNYHRFFLLLQFKSI